LLPGALSAVARWFAENRDEVWLVGDTVQIDARGIPLPGPFNAPRCVFGQRTTFRHLLHVGCPFSQPASFWKRSAFFEVGGLDTGLAFCFDYDLFLRLAKIKPSGQLHRFLAAFRVHPHSKSSTLQEVRDRENQVLRDRYGGVALGARGDIRTRLLRLRRRGLSGIKHALLGAGLMDRSALTFSLVD
jgi:hypothetical protein